MMVAAVSACFVSIVMLQVLYKLKTAKVFDRNRSRDDKGGGEVSDEDPFAIQLMAWCPESRMLSVAGVSANVIIYRFSKLEVTTEVVQVGNAEHFRYCTQTLKVSRVSMPTERNAGPPSRHCSESDISGGAMGAGVYWQEGETSFNPMSQLLCHGGRLHPVCFVPAAAPHRRRIPARFMIYLYFWQRFP